MAKRLQPKVVIAENVKGILQGNAIEYVKRIYEDFDKAGYYVQDFTLNAKYMGVPQARERVFFLTLRKDLAEQFLSDNFLEPYINMTFDEEPIPFGAIADYQGRKITKGTKTRKLWEHRIKGELTMCPANERVFQKYGFFNQKYVYAHKPCPTLAASKENVICFERPLYLSVTEVCRIQTFPLDYDFMGRNPHYVCGMSVPPIMMKQIAERVSEHWLSKIE